MVTATSSLATAASQDLDGDDFVSAAEVTAALPFAPVISHLVAGPAMRLLGLHAVNQLYRRTSRHEEPRAFIAALLAAMKVEVRAGPADLDRIPRSGPVVVMANHPTGALDGIALAELLSRVRPDVKIMANYLLRRIRQLRDLFIFVNPFDSEANRDNITGMRRALRWLEEGNLLVVFPAGEVARWSLPHRRVVEAAWNPSISALVRRSGAAVIPLHVGGQNSLAFHAAGVIHPKLRTALLPRELMNKHNRIVQIDIGDSFPAEHWPSSLPDQSVVDHVQRRVALLRHRGSRAAVSSQHSAPPAAACSSPHSLAAEVASLSSDQILARGGDCAVYSARAEQIPNVLQELGRLRELSFRAVGEGSGKDHDLDRYDKTYRHLFIWDARQQEIIGAYRLLPIESCNSRVPTPYTSTLFRYSEYLFQQIAPTIELGRSFVRPEYQRNYSYLLLLWKGIGALLGQDNACRSLLGAVSISRSYTDASRHLICEYLKQRHMRIDLQPLVHPRRPLRPGTRFLGEITDVVRDLGNLDELSHCVSTMEPDGKPIPVLLKHYLRLGAKAVAFNIDPAFSNALDVLMVLDLKDASSGFLRRCAPQRHGAGVFQESRCADPESCEVRS